MGQNNELQPFPFCGCTYTYILQHVALGLVNITLAYVRLGQIKLG
jgi:hypothetical protein